MPITSEHLKTLEEELDTAQLQLKQAVEGSEEESNLIDEVEDLHDDYRAKLYRFEHGLV